MQFEILLDREWNGAQLSRSLGNSSCEAPAQQGGHTSTTCSAVFKQTWQLPLDCVLSPSAPHTHGISVQPLEHNPEENTLVADSKSGTELLNSAQAK